MSKNKTYVGEVTGYEFSPEKQVTGFKVKATNGKHYLAHVSQLSELKKWIAESEGTAETFFTVGEKVEIIVPKSGDQVLEIKKITS